MYRVWLENMATPAQTEARKPTFQDFIRTYQGSVPLKYYNRDQIQEMYQVWLENMATPAQTNSPKTSQTHPFCIAQFRREYQVWRYLLH
jgi:hypothetical protein